MEFKLGVVTAAGAVAHRVVPVRFARAVSGFSDADAPDVDDHGFTVPAQFGPARGPAVGVLQGSVIRVKVVRDRLSPNAALFATSDNIAIADLDFPKDVALKHADTPAAGHAPARVGDCIYIKGTSASASDVETKVLIRFGSKTGPVLAELGVRVYPLISIPVQAHNVSINGTAAGITIATATKLFKEINKVYAQAGIHFDVLAALKAPVIAGFVRRGFVTLTNVNDAQNFELQTVLNNAPTAAALNAYFIPGYFDIVSNKANETLGIAFSQTLAAANPPTVAPAFPGCQAGITVFNGPDSVLTAHTAAHEIGHSLTLEHYNIGNPPNVVQNLWSHRCLMHNFVNLTHSALPVGYGNFSGGLISAGELLMTKARPGILQSLQIDTIRTAAKAGSCFPIARGGH